MDSSIRPSCLLLHRTDELFDLHLLSFSTGSISTTTVVSLCALLFLNVDEVRRYEDLKCEESLLSDADRPEQKPNITQ